MLLLTLPVFAYFLSRQKRKLQSLVSVFLDELAKEAKLIKVPTEQAMTVPTATAAAARSEPMPVELSKLSGPAASPDSKEVAVK